MFKFRLILFICLINLIYFSCVSQQGKIKENKVNILDKDNNINNTTNFLGTTVCNISDIPYNNSPLEAYYIPYTSNKVVKVINFSEKKFNPLDKYCDSNHYTIYLKKPYKKINLQVKLIKKQNEKSIDHDLPKVIVNQKYSNVSRGKRPLSKVSINWKGVFFYPSFKYYPNWQEINKNDLFGLFDIEIKLYYPEDNSAAIINIKNIKTTSEILNDPRTVYERNRIKSLKEEIKNK